MAADAVRAELPDEYEGMKLVHLPSVRKKSLETLTHTSLSAAYLMRHPVDVAVVFNSANSPFVPALRARGIPVAVHVDGLEGKRSKWQGAGKRYHRLAEAMRVRWPDTLEAEGQGTRESNTGRVAAATAPTP